MPRITDQTYFRQHHDLRGHWLNEPARAFLLLGALEQWALHMYYLPRAQSVKSPCSSIVMKSPPMTHYSRTSGSGTRPPT